MLKHITTLALLAVVMPSAVQAQAYAELGIALYEESWGAPEVTLKNPIGSVEVGYQAGIRLLGARPSVYARHLSGLADGEDGYGYTSAGIKARWEWN